MKYYLIALMLVIMGAGARTMFEIAYQGMAKEHDFAPSKETIVLIYLALWYIMMMVFDVILLTQKKLPYRNVLIGLLSIGILAPTIFMFFFH